MLCRTAAGRDKLWPTILSLSNCRCCVRIEPDSVGRWQVEITEQVGSETTAVTKQLIITTTVDGRTLIATIVAP